MQIVVQTDGKDAAGIQPGVGVDVTGGSAGLRDNLAGSSSQSPEASVQGIIAGGDDPEAAILIECRAVRG